eukprot:Nk52_evm28s2462 gene=Nk52_evmTU28s2462
MLRSIGGTRKGWALLPSPSSYASGLLRVSGFKSPAAVMEKISGGSCCSHLHTMSGGAVRGPGVGLGMPKKRIRGDRSANMLMLSGGGGESMIGRALCTRRSAGKQRHCDDAVRVVMPLDASGGKQRQSGFSVVEIDWEALLHSCPSLRNELVFPNEAPGGNETAQSSRFHSFWLRDHCQCKECYHADTHQRVYNTVEMTSHLSKSCTVKEWQVNTNRLSLDITWAGEGQKDHKSSYSLQYLLNHDYSTERAALYRKSKEADGWKSRVFWDREAIEWQVPYIKYSDIIKGTERADVNLDGLRRWLHQIQTYGFSLVRETPANITATQALIDAIAFVRETHYGGMWEFAPDLKYGDTAYTSEKLLPHTDNTYFTDPAGLQMLHVVEYEATGGESVLVDGFECARQLWEEDHRLYEILCSVNVEGEYIDDGFYFHASGPVFDDGRRTACGHGHRHGIQGLKQVRFNNNDRAVLDYIKFEDMDLFYRAWQRFFELVTDPKNQFTFTLTPGTALIFHNHRALHARESFVGHRKVVGGYINNDDYMSRCVSLGVH